MATGLLVSLTEDSGDWVYSTFMHRIELLEEWLEMDGPDQVGADNMREELLASREIVKSLERAGYKTIAERCRAATHSGGE